MPPAAQHDWIAQNYHDYLPKLVRHCAWAIRHENLIKFIIIISIIIIIIIIIIIRRNNPC